MGEITFASRAAQSYGCRLDDIADTDPDTGRVTFADGRPPIWVTDTGWTHVAPEPEPEEPPDEPDEDLVEDEEAAEPVDLSDAPTRAADLNDWVGDDPARAAAVRTAETASDRPRVTVLDHCADVLGDDDAT